MAATKDIRLEPRDFPTLGSLVLRATRHALTSFSNARYAALRNRIHIYAACRSAAKPVFS